MINTRPTLLHAFAIVLAGVNTFLKDFAEPTVMDESRRRRQFIYKSLSDINM